VGFLQPVLAEENDLGELTIVDGVHRVRAAMDLGLASVPVIVGDFRDNPELARIVQIGMNKMRGELDLAAVAHQVADLATAGWSIPDLQLIGFSEGELEDLLASTRRRDQEVLGGSLGGSPETTAADEEDAASGTKPFTLELVFAKKTELARAKKGLRKAAGRGRDLSEGLLRLLDGA
jgi:ParB-like chromosome segregation protein Spo0J